MTLENWFMFHAIRESCQNLYVKRDHDSPFCYPLGSIRDTPVGKNVGVNSYNAS